MRHSWATAQVGVTQIKWLNRVEPVKALSHGGIPLEPLWYGGPGVGPYAGISDMISFSSTSKTPVSADSRCNTPKIFCCKTDRLFYAVCFLVMNGADTLVLPVVLRHNQQQWTEISVGVIQTIPAPIQTTHTHVCAFGRVRVCEKVSVNGENHTFGLGRVKLAVVMNYYQILFKSRSKK